MAAPSLPYQTVWLERGCSTRPGSDHGVIEGHMGSSRWRRPSLPILFPVCPRFPPRVTVASSATAFVAKLGSIFLRTIPPTPLVRWESRRAGKSGVLRRDSGGGLEDRAGRHRLHFRLGQEDGEGQKDTSRMHEDDRRARLSQLFRRTRRSLLDVLRCRASGD